MSEYLFVFDEDSKAWWLKITDPETLMEYIKQTKGKLMSGAFELYWDLYKEANAGKTRTKSMRQILEEMPMERRFKLMTEEQKDFNLMLGAIIQAEKYGGTILDGFRLLNMEFGFKYLQDLRSDGHTYINKAGGSTFFARYTQFCRRDRLIFPDFDERDIRVTQFKGGEHWYAYIGNVEVKNGDTLRFDSKDNAYKRALELLGK